MKEREFYCVSCRSRVMVPAEDICVKIYKNKKMVGGKVPTLKSYCKCDCKLTKFIKHKDTNKMIDKFGKC